MEKQFIQYHKDEPGNPIKSAPGSFLAWANVRSQQPNWRPPATTGDRVWLIKGKEEQNGSKTYSIAYSFVMSAPPTIEGDRFVLKGTEGIFIADGAKIMQQPWFSRFLKSIGNGGISIQEIKDNEYLQYFASLINSEQEPDRLSLLADNQSTDEDSEESRSLREVLARRGQPEFRNKLLKAYQGKCCVTNCSVVDVLEAAHIDPHADGGGYETPNGLLLRSDIHTLFDLYLLAIDESQKIYVSNRLRSSEYGKLHGQRIRLPESFSDQPRTFALKQRMAKAINLDSK